MQIYNVQPTTGDAPRVIVYHKLDDVTVLETVEIFPMRLTAHHDTAITPTVCLINLHAIIHIAWLRTTCAMEVNDCIETQCMS